MSADWFDPPSPPEDINSFPAEIKNLIVAYLNNEDLYSLRNACHSIKKYADYELGKRLVKSFTHLNFTLGKEDLVILKGFVSNSNFRGRIRTITLSAAEMCRAQPGYRYPIIGYAKQNLSLLVRNGGLDWNGRNVVDDVEKVLVEAKTMQTLEAIRIGSTLGIKQLENARRGMRYDLTTLPKSTLSSVRDTKFDAEQEIEAFDERDISQCISDRLGMDEFLVVMFQALCNAGYSKRNVDVFIRYEDQENAWTRSLNAMRDAARNTILENIISGSGPFSLANSWSSTHSTQVRNELVRRSTRALDIVFPEPHSVMQACMSRVVRRVYFQDFKPRIREVQNGLTPASRVYQMLYTAVRDEAGKDIHVHMTNSPTDFSIRDINAPIPIIRHLHLKATKITCSSITDLFIGQQKSLVSLEMIDVTMINNTTWKISTWNHSNVWKVFKAIQSMTKLTQIVFRNLANVYKTDTIHFMPDGFTESIEVSGKAQVDGFIWKCTVNPGLVFKDSNGGGPPVIGFPTMVADSQIEK